MDNGISNNTQRKAVINSLLLKPQIMFFSARKIGLRLEFVMKARFSKQG